MIGPPVALRALRPRARHLRRRATRSTTRPPRASSRCGACRSRPWRGSAARDVRARRRAEDRPRQRVDGAGAASRPGTRGRPLSRTGSACRLGCRTSGPAASPGSRTRRVFEFGRSFPFDRRLFEDDIRGSLAWVEALAAAGAIGPADAARDRRRARGPSSPTAAADPSFVDGPDEDVHAFVERQLVERIGEAGKRLHTGRSRNEQVSVDLRLYLKRRIPAAPARDRAARRRDRRPGRARRRRADAGLHPPAPRAAGPRRALLAGARGGRSAATTRLFDVAVEVADSLPLGSGAVAGTSYPIDVAGARARPRVLARRRQQHRRLVRPRLRRRSSCTRARSRWCTSAGWPRTSSSSPARSSGSSSCPTRWRRAAA